MPENTPPQYASKYASIICQKITKLFYRYFCYEKLNLSHQDQIHVARKYNDFLLKFFMQKVHGRSQDYFHKICS